HPEMDEPERRSDHVDDGVECADLVELDALDRHAVHLRLGLGQTPEDGEGALPHPGRERAAGEEITDRDPRTMAVMGRIVGVAVVKVGMLPVNAHVELRRGDGGALRPLRPDLDALEPERAYRLAHALDREAEIEQRADGHVTADA